MRLNGTINTLKQFKSAIYMKVTETDILARAIKKHVTRTGDHQTALPTLSFYRRHTPTEPLPCVYPLSLALTVQGNKRVLIGEKVIEYSPGQSLVSTIDIPVVAYVTSATLLEPYLGLLLRLDPRAVALVASEMKIPTPDRKYTHCPISIESLDLGLLDALCRLVKLLDDAVLLPLLAPLIEQEIIIRLLTGPHSSHLRQLMIDETPSQQIDKIVTWMKRNLTQSVRIEELAAKANMSASTFRQHFHKTTGTSPLQYQKQLRLQEARELMRWRNMDVGQAANMVGYQSASQFSREYSRLFDISPQKDKLKHP